MVKQRTSGRRDGGGGQSSLAGDRLTIEAQSWDMTVKDGEDIVGARNSMRVWNSFENTWMLQSCTRRNYQMILRNCQMAGLSHKCR